MKVWAPQPTLTYALVAEKKELQERLARIEALEKEMKV